jgi:TPR repeat protein
MRHTSLRTIAGTASLILCLQTASGNGPVGQNPGASGHDRAAQGSLRGSPEELWQRAVVLIDRNNHRDALPLLTQAAKMGHAKAQATLGIAYQDGNGVRRDDKAAAYWFKLAAAQGHRAAQYALGAMYEEGQGGLPRDQRQAMNLYLASAKQGFDKAELILGVSYLAGDGLPNDRRQAIFWLQKSSAQGAQLAHDLLIVLADRSAPARFANMEALVSYLKKLAQQEMARAAAAAARNAPYRQDTNVVARINAARELNQWRWKQYGDKP